jgi:hypothetical protein
MDQSAQHTLGQTIFGNVQSVVLGHDHGRRELFAAQAARGDRQPSRSIVAAANAAKIQGHLIFQGADNELEYAGQIKAFASDASDSMEKFKTAQLGADAVLSVFAFGHLSGQLFIGGGQLRGAFLHSQLQTIVCLLQVSFSFASSLVGAIQ